MHNTTPEISLKQALSLTFGVELPIKGGKGTNIENAIIIERTSPLNDYVSIEHQVLKYLGVARRLISWNIIKQQLLVHNNRTYDIFELNVIPSQNKECAVQTEYFYFDITACFGPEKETQEDMDRKFTEMKLFVDVLNQAIDKSQVIKTNK
jgi:hypothetical protein